MSWNRRHSNLEELMFEALKKKKALTLQEIVEAISRADPDAFVGQTPRNSLYSVIYRKEKLRVENNEPTMFLTQKVHGAVVYSINPSRKYK